MSKIDSHYDLIRSEFNNQEHRAYIGGFWEELGTLQLSVLKQHGLQPHHNLLDIGCGSLRGGVKFIDYLAEFHYFGLDINPHLIQKGRALELTTELAAKVSNDNFTSNATFTADFDIDQFDFGIAFSLFTHLPAERIRECLIQLRPKFNHGKFLATVFIVEPEEYPQKVTQKLGIVTKPDEDPYHYTLEMLENLARETGWSFTWIGDFNHPRNQKMVMFS
ncbi:SAM-dependent methyltransferase [Rheinheimera maricola]|uniref:Class I SAM-dependent methyltransferase n=1 Tax=Rheinheimera maricola TaxID=2793282 RepID=A0ABS7X5D4_9GAMM|nr:class I SAM-dependent methyltransferase [Rheinheimera maricola]MBZ9610335.1 class I SAM-dependent methyltransferase [Rheinheimera maricola]